MANFGDSIDRADANALMPEELQREIVQGVEEKSASLQLMTHQPMKRRQTRIPVLSVLPNAYFTDTANDIGMRQTTAQAWSNKYLNAEEINAIVVVPKAVLADADYDVWAQVKPKIVEAIGIKLDGAVFFGTSKPDTWPSDLLTAAVAAGNVVTEGTSTIDLADDINLMMQTVEADGFEVSGFWGRVQMKGALRGIRGNFGQLLFYGGNQGVATAGPNPESLYDQPIKFSKAGLTGFNSLSGNAELIGGDFSQAIIGVREDVEFEMFTTGVITDDLSQITYNLLQQRMIAMMATMRVAFQVPNPINRQQQTEASRYPFACLKQA